jgi:Zn finger protein HypA/HybF involved in hydrogenase expression
MHELSIALEVCRMTEERVGPDGLRAVRAVGVEVGDDAGIEVGNLQFCLEALLAGR